MFFTARKATMVEPEHALPGRSTTVLERPTFHSVFGTPVDATPEGSQVAYFALGCFWGAEKLFWQLDGVTSTAAGYAGGYTRNPTYAEACSGRTGHAETVRVAYDPQKVSYADLIKIFFENHNPTEGMQQGNDIGTQYRSAIYTTTDEQARVAKQVRDRFQTEFERAGYGRITTEIRPVDEFYYAEAYHQQYLDTNPNGYCPVHATGVSCG